MKKLVLGFLTVAAITATGFAGTETYSAPGKESKQVEDAELLL